MSAKRYQERFKTHFSLTRRLSLGLSLAVTLPVFLSVTETLAAQSSFDSEATVSLVRNDEGGEEIKGNFYQLENIPPFLSPTPLSASPSSLSTLIAQEFLNNRTINLQVSQVESLPTSDEGSAFPQPKRYQNSIINIPVFAPVTPENHFSTQRETLSELLVLQPSPLPNLQGETLTFADFPEPTQEFTTAPTPSPVATSLKYRVVVNTPTSYQEEKLRSLVPESFRTVLNGKTMMQVGIFSTLESAESLKESLAINGFSVMIFPN